MKTSILYLLLIFTSLGWERMGVVENSPQKTSTNDQIIFSKNRLISCIGTIPETDESNQLIILNNNLFSQKDEVLNKYSLINPEEPILTNTFLNSQGKSFGKIFAKDNVLYVSSSFENKIYLFDENLQIITTYSTNVPNFYPNTLVVDSVGNFYIGGCNGTKGVIAKCRLVGNQLQHEVSYTFQMGQTNIESIVLNKNHLFISVKSGVIYSFNTNTISIGPISSTTHEYEMGNEKWGKTIQLVHQKLFWANWDAGFATVELDDPKNLSISSCISNARFRSQFPDSKAINVCDIGYNIEHDLLCIANGWSGIFLVNPKEPSTILDYLDVGNFQNYCIATQGNYIYTGSTSNGVADNHKGIKIYKLN